MRIYIVRHGDADSPTMGAERELTPRGEREADTAGRLLAEQGADRVLYSPKLRTRQTATRIIDAFGDIGSGEAISLLPPSTGEQVAAVAEDAAVERLILVSHLPLVAELVGWFTTGNTRDFSIPGFPSGGIVALDMEVVGRGMASQAWYAFPPDFTPRTH